MMSQGENVFKAVIKYAILAVVLMVIAGIMSTLPRREDNHDTWLVEVEVMEKVVAEMDGEQVYLIRTQNRNGEEAIYEINQQALNKTLNVEGVFEEIKEEKIYQFRVAEKNKYDSHYPVVCGAVSLVDGFSPETKPEGK